jgi:PHD/YefM family antitoxin component YafN of YafNO toxin-antitoxin module
MGNTSFVSFRELRASTAKIDDMLTDDGKIVVTSNGKPKAIMIHVGESDFEETLSIINQIKLAKAINNIRAAAERNGLTGMTMEEIDEEIRQSRQDNQLL